MHLGLSLGVTGGGQGGGTAAEAELATYGDLFAGTGRVALACYGANAAAFAAFGDTATTARFAERVGQPIHVLLKEMSTNVWLGYECPKTSASGVTHLSSYGVYKPMKRLRYDNAACTDGDGGAVAYPQTATSQWIECDVGSVEPQATRLGVIVGFTGSNCGIATVTITNNADASSVTPNLLPTAAQLAARGQIASSALVSNGGTLADAAYCLDTSANGRIRMAQTRHNHVPVADGLTAGDYTIRLTYTAIPHATGGTVDRFYPAYFTYGTAAMTHADSGAQLYRCGYWAATTDASSSEMYTLDGRKQGTASARVLMGCGHGSDADTSLSFTVDGASVVLYAKTVSRARASNVATLVLDRATTLAANDVVTVSGLGGTGYNAEGVTITGVSTTTLTNDTITYANTGSNEGATADTGGQAISHEVVTGSVVQMSRNSTITHSTDGAVATVAASLSLNRTALSVRSNVTLTQNFDHGTQTYPALSTIWGALRSTYGPEFGGQKVWKIIGTETKHTPTAGDGSENLKGEYLGYIAWDTVGGQASAVIQRSRTMPETAWNGGLADLFEQDRSPESQGIDKAYLRYTDTAGDTDTAGTVLRGGYDRYDMLLAPGTVDDRLPT